MRHVEFPKIQTGLFLLGEGGGGLWGFPQPNPATRTLKGGEKVSVLYNRVSVGSCYESLKDSFYYRTNREKCDVTLPW